MNPVLHDQGAPEPSLPGEAKALSARPRAWQRMLSGRRLDLLDPDPADIELDDIALGLARVARWNGQTVGAHAFSVAQHSLLVEAIAAELQASLTPQDRLAALLHDAPEYVVGDMITPLKGVIGAPYGEVEARLLAAVHRRFGLPEPSVDLHRLIKQADRAAAYLEAVRLAGFSAAEAHAVFGAPGIQPQNTNALLACWPSEMAAMRFRERALALLASCAVEAAPPCDPAGQTG